MLLGTGGNQLFKEIKARRDVRKNKAEGKFDRKELAYKNEGEKLEFGNPNLRTGEMERLKSQIRTKVKRDQLRDYALFVIIFVVLFSVFYYVMN